MIPRKNLLYSLLCFLPIESESATWGAKTTNFGGGKCITFQMWPDGKAIRFELEKNSIELAVLVTYRAIYDLDTKELDPLKLEFDGTRVWKVDSRKVKLTPNGKTYYFIKSSSEPDLFYNDFARSRNVQVLDSRGNIVSFSLSGSYQALKMLLSCSKE